MIARGCKSSLEVSLHGDFKALDILLIGHFSSQKAISIMTAGQSIKQMCCCQVGRPQFEEE